MTSRTAWIVALGWLACCGPAHADESKRDDTHAATRGIEEASVTYDSLRTVWVDLVATPPAARDEITWIEAEEIAAIAEEFWAEGDVDIAGELLQEALALVAAEDDAP